MKMVSQEFRAVLFSAMACAFGSGMIVGFLAGPIVALAASVAGFTLVGVAYGLVKFNEWKEKRLITRIRQEVLLDAQERRIEEQQEQMEGRIQKLG
jgi:uncharacterized membrane protein (Fun14 family)